MKMKYLPLMALYTSLLSTARANDRPNQAHVPLLKGEAPLVLGEVFHGGAMTFIAYLPSSESDPLSWCTMSHPISLDTPTSVPGLDNLQVRDYFGQHAYVEWNDNRFLDCVITPESTNLDVCEWGYGPRGRPLRRWSCWVVGAGETEKIGMRRAGFGGGEERVTLQAGGRESQKARETGQARSAALLGVFTAAITGM